MEATADKPKVQNEAYSLSWGEKAFRLRCLECTRAKSKNGNLMLKQTFEIFGADPIKDNTTGDFVDVNGLQVFGNQMLMTQSLKYINNQRNSLGLPEITEADVESVEPLDYKRTEGAALVKAEVGEKTNPVTGEVIMNPLTNKAVTETTRKITSWLTR